MSIQGWENPDFILSLQFRPIPNHPLAEPRVSRYIRGDTSGSIGQTLSLPSNFTLIQESGLGTLNGFTIQIQQFLNTVTLETVSFIVITQHQALGWMILDTFEIEEIFGVGECFLTIPTMMEDTFESIPSFVGEGCGEHLSFDSDDGTVPTTMNPCP